MAKAIKTKATGRPGGSPNKSSGQVRNENYQLRCSEGFNKVLEALAVNGKSQPDILHEALQQYAIRNTDDKKIIFWIKLI